MKRLFICSAVLLMAVTAVSAQTKQETSLYTKTLKKPSVKAYDKFLNKYPESVFSLDILTRRDQALFDALDQDDAYAVADFIKQHPDSPVLTLANEVMERHNTTSIAKDEALAIAKAALPEAADAVGYKWMGKEQVVALAMDGAELVAYSLTKDPEGVWMPQELKRFERYSLDSNLGSSRLEGPSEMVKVNGRNLLSFNTLNYSSDAKSLEYVLSLYDIENDMMTNAMFYGRNLGKSLDEYRIEGQSPEAALSGGVMLPENVYLLNAINENPDLQQISKADALTDDSIAWWQSKNPTAETKATRLTFGALDEESSLVDGFKKCSAKYKDSSANFTAALFNIRGYTVIVAYSKANKSYNLVWVEPECKNKNRDKYLNTIYFDDANSISMFYYKGKTTFKYHVNLATHALRR
ncbi:MAG: hypothetical protein Q4G10_07185 [Bacteroidia bacterium]|nr:hypothetical protein [Bacteroidia bacterium]